MINVLLCLQTQHDWRLVALAALVCVAATAATFFLYGKVPLLPAWRHWTWLGLTGLAAGSGIWTTHFVAMLAFKSGLPTGYAEIPTLGSMLVAVLSTTGGFALAAPRINTPPPRSTILAGGLVVGLGITAMHYVGMLGYRTTGTIAWSPAYVAASVAIGAIFAAGALAVGRPGGSARRQAAAAGLLTLAIVGMHFTGMTAVTIVPDPTIAPHASLLSGSTMLVIAVAVTAMILVTAVAGAIFDTASRYTAMSRLREAMDAMPDAIVLFDANDRVVTWNATYAALCRAAAGVDPVVGLSFEAGLQHGLSIGAFPDAIGREEAWLAERRAAHSGERSSMIERTPTGRWLQMMERRTADGGTVVTWSDVTELKIVEAAMAQARDQAEELARRADVAEAVAGLGHWRLDVATSQLTWSPQLYRIYGLEPGSPLDLTAIMDMGHPEDAEQSKARLARQLLDGAEEQVATRIVRASGEIRYLSGASRIERGPDGEIVCAIGTLADITDHKLADIAVAQSEERFRRLAVNAPDMIAESTLDGIMTYVSPASLAITGFTPEELVGKPFASLMEPEDAAKVLEMVQTVFASKGRVLPWAVEFRAKHKAGANLWLECQPTLAADPETGLFTGITDVIRDITPRKALEARLRAAQADAEAAAAVKAEFLANMSHELRTPLTSIIGFTGLAAEQAELSDLTRDYVQRVEDASRALLCTVNDILDFSKLEAGQVTIHPQPVRLARLNRATLDLFTPQAGAKDLRLTLDDDGMAEDLTVSVDPDRIRQVLLNFVSNAVKFTGEGGVTLRTRYDADAERLAVEVIDTGAGIAPDKLDLLFKRFSQIDGSLTRAQGGTGLGLAICKGLVEALGGEVGVESKVGEGSRFWFTVPAPRAEAIPDTAGQAIARPTFDGVRVLVADDHATNRELVRLFLAGVGAEVTEAVDGEDAVRLAAEWPFDVVLMDLRMPRLDGLGALRRIRSVDGPNDATPILAFSADVTPELTGRLTAEGFDGLVAKPLEAPALIAAVAQATAFAPVTPDMEADHAA